MQGSPVRFEFEDVSPVEKRLKVEIDKAQVNKKLDDSYRQLGRQVNIKGFRPGKAPRSLLESMFGKKVASDAARELVNETIGDIIGKQTLRIISEPMLEELADAQKDQDLRYSARIELMPQIEVKDYEGIAVQKREGKVTDEQVNAALESRRQSQQELKPVEGRDKAEAGDVLTIALTGTLSHLTYKDKEMHVERGNAAGELLERHFERKPEVVLFEGALEFAGKGFLELTVNHFERNREGMAGAHGAGDELETLRELLFEFVQTGGALAVHVEEWGAAGNGTGD